MQSYGVRQLPDYLPLNDGNSWNVRIIPQPRQLPVQYYWQNKDEWFHPLHTPQFLCKFHFIDIYRDNFLYIDILFLTTEFMYFTKLYIL